MKCAVSKSSISFHFLYFQRNKESVLLNMTEIDVLVVEVYAVRRKLEFKNCQSISTSTVLTVATTVLYLLFLANFNQVHEVMNLCFEKNVGKQCGASCIRRQLEEAWSTEGIWDTYL